MHEIVIADIRKRTTKERYILSTYPFQHQTLNWPPEKAAVPPVWSWAEVSLLEKRSRQQLLQSPDAHFDHGLALPSIASKLASLLKLPFPLLISLPTKFSAKAVNFAPRSTATTLWDRDRGDGKISKRLFSTHLNCVLIWMQPLWHRP